ncbi:MAG TPA: hypothetical protein VJP41_09935 [Gaiellaceae bacterium]|nr:hypothetical protein [Gaiellaceae bacterium]
MGTRQASSSSVYEAELVAGDLRPDDEETQAVGWFAPEELAALPLGSVARATLETLGLVAEKRRGRPRSSAPAFCSIVQRVLTL